jgi:ribosomal protein S4
MIFRRGLIKQNKKIVKKKINKIKITAVRFFKKQKLKKKWRFWRTFKFFFLKNKTLRFFSKIKWFFNQKRILWRHLATVYGKKIKSLVFKKVSKKIAFGSFFFFTLAFLELRLNILIVRMRFAGKLLIANEIIQNGSILVNNKKRSIHYLTRVNDVVQKQIPRGNSKKPKILKRRKWKAYLWRRWKKKWRRGRKGRKPTFLRRQVLYLNFIELNYRILSGIIIRKPMLGEILLLAQKKLISRTMLKKLYYLY